MINVQPIYIGTAVGLLALASRQTGRANIELDRFSYRCASALEAAVRSTQHRKLKSLSASRFDRYDRTSSFRPATIIRRTPARSITSRLRRAGGGGSPQHRKACNAWPLSYLRDIFKEAIPYLDRLKRSLTCELAYSSASVTFDSQPDNSRGVRCNV